MATLHTHPLPHDVDGFTRGHGVDWAKWRLLHWLIVRQRSNTSCDRWRLPLRNKPCLAVNLFLMKNSARLWMYFFLVDKIVLLAPVNFDCHMCSTLACHTIFMQLLSLSKNADVRRLEPVSHTLSFSRAIDLLVTFRHLSCSGYREVSCEQHVSMSACETSNVSPRSRLDHLF
jgi:hypothetical protein